MIPSPSDLESRLMDLYPGSAVVLEAGGQIVHVNRSWKAFGLQNGLNDPDFCIGRNYLEECDRASQRGAKGSAAVAAGLRKLLAGGAESFKQTYRCHAPGEARWFQLIAAPLGRERVEGLLLLHVNVTHQRLLAQRFARHVEYRRNRVVVCAWCKRVRNENDWTTVEEYFTSRYQFAFSHGICPECQGAFRV